MNQFFRAACLTFVMLSGLFVCNVCYASRSGDGEYWQILEFGHDIDSSWQVTASQESRMGRHNGNPYVYNFDVGLVYRNLFKGVDVGINFLKEYEKDSKGKFRQENRPHFNIIVKGKLLALDVSNRFRFEYKEFQTKEDIWKFRNKTTVNLPFKITSLNLQPYISEEFFITIGTNDVDQNRLYGGFTFPVGENLKANLHYMWRHEKISGGSRDTNIIGATLRFDF